MSLNKLQDDQVVKQAEVFAASERKIYSQMIGVLEEIERRKIYLKRGFPSLFEFCTTHLKYSAGAAHRRISSMRLIKDLPSEDKSEINSKLNSGAVNLTHLSQVSKLVREKPKSFDSKVKMEVLRKLENLSAKQTEVTLLRYGAKPAARRESLRVLSPTEARLSVVLDEDSQALLKRFMELTAKKNPWASKEKALKIALQMGVEKLDPLQQEARRKKKSSSLKSKLAQKKPQSTLLVTSEAETKKRTRHIPLQTRRDVWQQNQKQGCVYVDKRSKRKCGKFFGLEVDHILEYSKGGGHSTKNLRLLCSAHNRLRNFSVGLH